MDLRAWTGLAIVVIWLGIDYLRITHTSCVADAFL